MRRRFTQAQQLPNKAGLPWRAVALTQPAPALLGRAQCVDEAAFAELVRAYQTPVFNYVYRLVGNRALAEDLTQDVFLRVHQGLARFTLRAKFTTWLFQITKNRVLDEFRSRERRPQSASSIEDAGLVFLDPSPEDAELIDALWRAIAALPTDLKTALLLRDVVGMPYLEIAETLEISLANVKWRIFRAREDVGRRLDDEGVGPTSRMARTAT